MPDALVVVHDEVPGRGARQVGTVGPALAALGFAVSVVTLVDGTPAPDPAGAGVVVVLGAAESAADDAVPWLGAELDLLARAVAAGVPVLGICFGAQALARVLGGTVGRAPRSEHGFVALGSAEPDVLAPGTWMEFHDDAFTLPPGASELARNAVGCQAFTHGPHLGVQFHPEITPEVFASWVEAWTAAGLDDAAVTGGADVPALRAELDARADDLARACRALVAGFCTRAGVPTPGPGRAP